MRLNIASWSVMRIFITTSSLASATLASSSCQAAAQLYLLFVKSCLQDFIGYTVDHNRSPVLLASEIALLWYGYNDPTFPVVWIGGCAVDNVSEVGKDVNKPFEYGDWKFVSASETN